MTDTPHRSGLAHDVSSSCPFQSNLAQASLPDKSAQRKTMVLTGASRGIGHATVKLFSQAGWRIITCSRHPFNRDRCPWDLGPEDHVQVDLADHRAVPLAIADIRARLNGDPVHALVNNAVSEGRRQYAHDGADDLDRDLDECVPCEFPCADPAGARVVRRAKKGRGTVVNLTSIVGVRVHPFAGTAYATSKAALACLTREMAHDFAPHGIRVNAISPGEIRTDILSPDTEARLAPSIPMRRIGTPEEVANVVFFLCSDAASYLTGEEIQINGGQHL